MSWLFDRLCELAAADRVEVVIDAATSQSERTDDSTSFADVLLRGSQVPQLTIWVLPAHSSGQTSPHLSTSVDLDVVSDDCARSAIDRLLGAQQRSGDVVLQVGSAALTTVPKDRVEQVFLDISSGTPPDVRRLFATDRSGHSEVLSQLVRNGLGIAIGGVDPQAAIKVQNFDGAVSIVDALVTLRSFAFGVNSVDHPAADSLRRAGLLPAGATRTAG